MNKELKLDNTTLLVEGNLVKGQKGDHNTIPIADHFEGEEYWLKVSYKYGEDEQRDVTQFLNDIAILLHEHPVTCSCGEKHIIKLNDIIDEKLNQ